LHKGDDPQGHEDGGENEGVFPQPDKINFRFPKSSMPIYGFLPFIRCSGS
jgi:hypothetical protein